MAVLGQPRLFVSEPDAKAIVRWSVSVAGRRHLPTTSLPLAVAQARAAALGGYRAVIVGTDGCAADVHHDEAGFRVIPFGSAAWPGHVRRLLDEHG